MRKFCIAVRDVGSTNQNAEAPKDRRFFYEYEKTRLMRVSIFRFWIIRDLQDPLFASFGTRELRRPRAMIW